MFTLSCAYMISSIYVSLTFRLDIAQTVLMTLVDDLHLDKNKGKLYSAYLTRSFSGLWHK